MNYNECKSEIEKLNHLRQQCLKIKIHQNIQSFKKHINLNFSSLY